MKQTLASALVSQGAGLSGNSTGALLATVERFDGDGLVVVSAGQAHLHCEYLQPALGTPPLERGDRVLVLRLDGAAGGVVLGRLAPRDTLPMSHLKLQAAESLTLECGESTLTLRSNGQVLLKGEDVTVRAKGTQRIRAGNVAIN